MAVVSPYRNLDRPPLHRDALRRALVVPGGLWTELIVKTDTTSTNADVAEAACAGAPEGLVVVAEVQRAGRGRLGRQWQSPPRAGLMFSVLLRPASGQPGGAGLAGPAGEVDGTGQPGAAGKAVWPGSVPASRYGWLPLLAGVALAGTVRRLGALEAVLKWPNDLLVDGRKCAGILAEAAGDAVVLGIGLNVTMRAAELPTPEATSLALAGSTCTDRDPLLRAVLRELAGWYRRWRDTGGDSELSGLRAEYRMHCATLGRPVRVVLPGGTDLTGTASDVDTNGRLVVTTPAGTVVPVAAGDVVHLR